jgi:hypothetical protein
VRKFFAPCLDDDEPPMSELDEPSSPRSAEATR